MSADYIPKSQSSLATWARNFSAIISAAPGTFGLMAADAAAIAQGVGLFDNALALTQSPATKTKSAVADKDGRKAAMLVTLRWYAQTIKRNLGISDEAKINLGLHLDAAGPGRVPEPSTIPVLYVYADAPLAQRVEFCDSASGRKAKPPGVIGMLLAVMTTAYDPSARYTTRYPDPFAAPIHGLVTRQPYRVQFPETAYGQLATYFAHWVTRDGRPGPWSSMRQLMIAG